jgi:hypothetical protein
MKKNIITIMLMCLLTSVLLAQQKKQTEVKSKQESATATSIVYSENFDTITAWKTYKAEGCEVKTSKSQGKDGSGLKIDYDLGDKDWVAVEKEIKPAKKFPESFVIKYSVKASGNENYLETKLVDKDGSVYGYKFLLPTDNKWQNVEITSEQDLSYWWGGNENLDEVARIGFAISKNNGGKGVVEIDNIEIVEVPKKSQTIKKSSPDVLDDFEDRKGWIIFTAEGAKLNLKIVPGKDGNALQAQYDLADGEGKWVCLQKRFKLDFSKNKIFKFWVKAEGENNRLEFKVVDKDGSVFGQRFEDLENKWQEITVSVDELEYWWGGDEQLSQPEKIEFAISSIDGGKGSIYIDQLRLTK